MESSAPSSSTRPSSIADADPITRNTLRYTISAREYDLLHHYLLSRAPVLSKKAPSPEKREANLQVRDDYNAATIRLTLRLFLTSFSGLKAWDALSQRLFARGTPPAKVKTSLLKSPNFRLSLSLSSILFFHRVLHRFFIRLRESLRTEDARPFRRRNPRLARALTSRLAPAAGASLSGLFLGLSPADQTRLTVTIYLLSRSFEFLFNHLDNRGYFKKRPWWFGSWLLMPLCCGQLLHAFVFDRDCFPEAYGNFIMKRSPEYVQHRPEGRPTSLPWPSVNDIVDGLAETSRLKWPGFVSPILFPNAKTLQTSLEAIAPITDPAHPGIRQLSCAILHPNDPSCLRTFVNYYLRAFPQMAKFWAIVYGAFATLRVQSILAKPVPALNALAARILRTSVFLTSAVGTAWGTICLLQSFLPGKTLPTGRWFVSGYMAGLWAFLERKGGRSQFLYSTRLSMDSLWKVGRKRGWWKGVKGGDVLLFTASMALMGMVFEKDPLAVEGAILRKGLGVLRGEGWVDRGAGSSKEEGKEKLDERKKQ